MAGMIFTVVTVAVFVHWIWGELKRDFGVKTFYTLKELEERDALAAEKSAARFAAVRKFFGI